jgi:hypothetical protein
MFLFVLLLVLVTGYGVSLLHTWGPLYRWNLLFHPALATALGVYIYRYSRHRLEVHRDRFSRPLWVDVPTALVFLLPFLSLPWLNLPDLSVGGEGMFGSVFFGLTLVFLLGAQKLAALERRVWYRSAVLLGYLVYAIWSLLLFSGLSTLVVGQQGGVTHIFERHRDLAHGFSGLLIVFLVLVHWRKARGLNLVERVKINWRRTYAVLLGAVAILGLMAFYEFSYQNVAVDVHVSRVPFAQRPVEAQQSRFAHPEGPAPVMGLTNSCGGASGCHQGLVDQLKASNHGIGFQTPHSQRILALMQEELGPDNWPSCAGCHAPPALWDPDKDAAYFKTHANMSCTTCHLIGDVSIEPSQEAARYTLEMPMRHLELFLEDGQERELDAWTAAQIRLSPLNHGEIFSKPLHSTDTFCRVCHHQEIPSDESTGLAQPKCVNCHMQKEESIGFEGTRKNHFWAGSNLAVPHFAQKDDSEERTKAWIDGDYVLTFPGWENLWEMRQTNDALPSKSFWILMHYEALSKPTAGETLSLRIISSNVGPGHPIPASPMDLAEMWLELRVRDHAGNILFETGKLKDNGRIPEGSIQLGGTMLDHEGKPIDRHRVWHPHDIKIEAQLMPGEHRFDTFEITVPEGARDFLKVDGRWNYRKLSREFADWAYGPEKEIPVARMGHISVEIPLAESHHAHSHPAPQRTR